MGGYRDPGWPEDYDLILRLWAAGHGLANVPAVLHHWREGHDRLSRTDARYDLEAFRRCKAHWLARTLLAGPTPGSDGSDGSGDSANRVQPPWTMRRRAAVVWGAGPVGKRFALALQDEDVRVAAFVELDPRKIGQEIHGAPVVAMETLPELLEREPNALVLGAVGSPSGREAVRAEAERIGLVEGSDFIAVA